jgi:hypothetical protein
MQRKLSDLARRRIAAALPLREGVALNPVLADIESAIQTFWTQDDEEARIENIEFNDGLLVLTRKTYSSKGRPPEKALRTYVTSIVGIYERATGQQIGRNVDAYADDHREKPHPFLALCMRTAGKRYPTRIVREVLESLHTR